MREFFPGEILLLKKKHPCGENSWELIRVGADLKLRCRGCGHLLILPRRRLGKLLQRENEAEGRERSGLREELRKEKGRIPEQGKDEN